MQNKLPKILDTSKINPYGVAFGWLVLTLVCMFGPPLLLEGIWNYFLNPVFGIKAIDYVQSCWLEVFLVIVVIILAVLRDDD